MCIRLSGSTIEAGLHCWCNKPSIIVGVYLSTVQCVCAYWHMSSTLGQSGGIAWRQPSQQSMSVGGKEWHQKCSGDTASRLPSVCPCWETNREKDGEKQGEAKRERGENIDHDISGVYWSLALIDVLFKVIQSCYQLFPRIQVSHSYSMTAERAKS